MAAATTTGDDAHDDVPRAVASTTGSPRRPPRRSHAPRHAPPRRRHPVLFATALTATAAVVFVTTAAVAAYVDLQSQITVDDVDPLLGADRPAQLPVAPPTRDAPPDPADPYAGQPLNILVMGTDLRDAANIAVAGGAVEDGMRSDTTLLVHVAADRTRAEIVSIPRDSLVDIPTCTRTDGTVTPARSTTMFNRAFTYGGGPEEDIAGAAACTRRTVEQLTGVRTTDHVVVKMNGVEPIVDALGGVRMCMPEPVHGREVDLDLPAGEQRLDGYEAINFLRARKGTGFGLELGSDLQRIERQQAFLDATVHEVTSKNLLTSTPQLYRVVESILASISTSPDLGSPRALVGLALSLRSIPPENVVFTAVPVVDAPWDNDRVLWTAEADEIWARIAADEPPPGAEPAPGTDGGTGTGAGTGDGETGDDGDGTSTDPNPSAGTPSPAPSATTAPGVCPD